MWYNINVCFLSVNLHPTIERAKALSFFTKTKVKVKFIGGDRKDRITDKDRQLYQICDLISKRTTSNLFEKVKIQKNINEIEEEKIGIIKTVNNLSAFIEREIEPVAIEKIRMEPEYKERAVRSFNGLLEEIMNEFMRDNDIIAITTADASNQLYLSAKEMINSVKTKVVEGMKKRVLSLV
jgi:hypothetical protein